MSNTNEYARLAAPGGNQIAEIVRLTKAQYDVLAAGNPAKAARLIPVERPVPTLDKAREKFGEETRQIVNGKLVISRAVVRLSNEERAEHAAAESAAAVDRILAVAARRAAITQAIADHELPANHPMPEYPAKD